MLRDTKVAPPSKGVAGYILTCVSTLGRHVGPRLLMGTLYFDIGVSSQDTKSEQERTNATEACHLSGRKRRRCHGRRAALRPKLGPEVIRRSRDRAHITLYHQ
jgi:hypothetical protein